MSFNPRTDSSPPPGHQDLDASLAAPAQVDQVGGTTWVFECIDCHWQCQQDELGPCIDLASDDELGCPVCGGCVFPAKAA